MVKDAEQRGSKIQCFSCLKNEFEVFFQKCKRICAICHQNMSSFLDGENMTLPTSNEKCGKLINLNKTTYDAKKRKTSGTKSATDDEAEY